MKIKANDMTRGKFLKEIKGHAFFARIHGLDYEVKITHQQAADLLEFLQEDEDRDIVLDLTNGTADLSWSHDESAFLDYC